MDNKRKFKLFDTQREGPGVKKTDVYTKPDLKGFFIRYKTYFTRLLSALCEANVPFAPQKYHLRGRAIHLPQGEGLV